MVCLVPIKQGEEDGDTAQEELCMPFVLWDKNRKKENTIKGIINYKMKFVNGSLPQNYESVYAGR